MNINRNSEGFSVGFTTAGGSPINISNKALTKAKKILTDELAETDNYGNTYKIQKGDNEITGQLPNIEFQSASGQCMNVSTKAIAKAKILLQENVEEFKAESPNAGFQNTNDQSVKTSKDAIQKARTLFDNNIHEFRGDLPNIGFQATSGKNISISKGTSIKARTLFEGNSEEFIGKLSNVGFQTASGQNVKVSKGPLTNAKILLDNDSNEFNKELPNVGFRTASGSNVKISKEALSKAEILFDNDINEFRGELPNIGFQAASDKNISASKDALLKARTLFEGNTEEFIGKQSNVGFQTASGHNIQISKEALSKAETLFDNDVTEFKEELSNIGFQAASGKNISVSKEALLKAKTLFEDNAEEFNGKLSNVGFQTASGQNIQISKEALSKAETLFDNDVTEFKEELSNIGFQAASGKNISVSKEALLKAKTLFKDNAEEFNGKLSNVGFQTASGQNIQISKEALSKAETLFDNDVTEFKEELSNIGFQVASGKNISVSKEALLKAKTLFEDNAEEFNGKLPNVGFQTANGQSVKVSKNALSRAQTLFEDDTYECKGKLTSVRGHNVSGQNFKISKESTSETLCENDTVVHKKDLQNIGLQTPCDIKITNEALINSILFQEDFSETSEKNVVLAKPLQKRKLSDLDDNACLRRQTKSNQFKKLRFSNEFSVPKPVETNTIDAEYKRNKSTLSVSTHVLISNSDNKNLNDNIVEDKVNIKNTEIIDNSLISHEIAASTVALLVDEKNTDFSKQWISASETKENDDMANVPSSPVIGGQFIQRKRRHAGCRKKRLNDIKSRENKQVHSDKSKGINGNSVYSNQSTKEEDKHSMERHKLIDDTKKCDAAMSEYGDTQLMLDFINQSAVILEKRLQAALEQDKQIILKQRSKLKPTTGKLYFHRKSNAKNRVSWEAVSKGNKPIPCTYEELIERKLPPEILDIVSTNAVGYKFRCTDFYGQSTVQNNISGIKLEDGVCLILDENGYVGITEIKRSFLASPGVDPNFLPNGWVENHYKWIIWKLASIDRIKLGSVVLPRALTPGRVMMELKYRYDREIDRSQRSALRKILEKDDVPSKRMVLCVSSIIENNVSTAPSGSPIQLKTPPKKMIVTDGWYSIQTSIDQAMITNIMSDKVKEGTKLVTYGAELLNCDQGYLPLEVPENVCLKLHTNSTRRARWDAKLGYAAPAGPLCVKLQTICQDGGLVGKLKVTIARVYPLLYHEKTLAGESIFRNARCEEKANIAYEIECRSMIEAFYAKAEKYFYGERKKTNLDGDSIDVVAREWNEDCDKLSKEEFLSEQDLQQLKNDCRLKEEKFRQKLESRLKESLPPSRQVTSLLKIRIIDEDTSAILSIWSPNEEITDILKEGNCISICNVMPSTRRFNELQLTSSRSTVFRQLNASNPNYLQRTYTALYDIKKITFFPVYGEFDTVGIVTCIKNEPCGMKNFEAVYLAFPHTDSQSSYLSILFWQGIAAYGYTEILTIGSFIACSNLEWRRTASWNIPIAYCTERSTFTRNPRQNHLHQPFINLKCLITDVNAYISACAAKILEEMEKKPVTRMSDQYIPDRSNINKIVANENMNSEKQPNDCTHQQLAGSSLLSHHAAKSPAIQKRLAKLQYYGEPPNLSPIVLNNSSKRVSLEYQSPLRSADGKRARVHSSLKTKYIENKS